MSVRTVQELIDRIDAGDRVRFLPFYGHKPQPEPGPWLLSQWAQTPFTVDGIEYATAEHWMMAGKARLFADDEMLAQILDAPSPRDAKALGRAVRNFDDEAWKARRYEIVLEGSVHKFSAQAAWCEYLVSTAPKLLVEAAPRDRIWGIGLGTKNPAVHDPRHWRGQNLLGFALTEARERLASI